jgi:hypothetical protein
MNTRVHCWIYTGAIVITAFLVLFFHVWKIASIPNGLYQDETAIGYNASLIADTGFDEHQHFLPVYFESFSDYKAPIYIYAVAGFFKLFDPSIFLLRFTSVFFFLLTLIGCVCVVSMLTEKPDRRVLLPVFLSKSFPRPPSRCGHSGFCKKSTPIRVIGLHQSWPQLAES